MRNPSNQLESAPRRPRLASVLLGLFILWQFVFIIGSSILALPEESPLPPVSRVFENYSWLTGQEQGWRQFTPGAPQQAAFVVVELHGALPLGEKGRVKGSPKPVEIRSESEPAELGSFLRPFGATRLSGYELQFTMIGLKPGAYAWRDNPADWRKPIAEAVRVNAKALRAYLAWRLGEFQQQQPDAPPPEFLTMSLRIYRVPPSTATTWAFGPPEVMPLARWRPDDSEVEAYDPVARSWSPSRPLPQPKEAGRGEASHVGQVSRRPRQARRLPHTAWSA